MADSTRSVVAVVDDDHRTLESLADLLEAAGYAVRLYSSVTALYAGGIVFFAAPGVARVRRVSRRYFFRGYAIADRDRDHPKAAIVVIKLVTASRKRVTF